MGTLAILRPFAASIREQTNALQSAADSLLSDGFDIERMTVSGGVPTIHVAACDLTDQAIAIGTAMHYRFGHGTRKGVFLRRTHGVRVVFTERPY